MTRLCFGVRWGLRGPVIRFLSSIKRRLFPPCNLPGRPIKTRPGASWGARIGLVVAFWAFLFILAYCRADEVPLDVITNKVPSIGDPSGWSYPSSAGTYFWNGFRYMFAAGLVSLAVTWVRRIMGGGAEES